MAKDLQVVGLRVGHELFGVPIALVREIVRMPNITAVPNTPDYVEGVINLRGKIISVIDLRKRFGSTDPELTGKTRVVVLEIENRTAGLIVDSASEVLKIPLSEIEPPSSVFPDGEVDYVTGVGKLDGRLIILLDMGKVLKGAELRHLDSPVASAAPV